MVSFPSQILIKFPIVSTNKLPENLIIPLHMPDYCLCLLLSNNLAQLGAIVAQTQHLRERELPLPEIWPLLCYLHTHTFVCLIRIKIENKHWHPREQSSSLIWPCVIVLVCKLLPLLAFQIFLCSPARLTMPPLLPPPPTENTDT